MIVDKHMLCLQAQGSFPGESPEHGFWPVPSGWSQSSGNGLLSGANWGNVWKNKGVTRAVQFYISYAPPTTEFNCWYTQTRAAFISSQTDNSATRLGQPGGIRSTSSEIEGTKTLATDDNSICDASLGALVKMFPQVCQKQLKHCLQVADGDLGKAVNLALDRAEQVTTNKAQSSPTDRGQVTSSMSPNLPDSKPNESVSTLSAEERTSMLERYGIVQAERTESLCPVPHAAAEPKSTVRYLDGKVVDTKGKKYIEIKPEYPNMPQPQFLKALRRYKKH
ncbi:hypothetical protein CRM22_007394 [Opisthorchis felineus]|uniref:CUE domain-containing protein n=1 Tax=Opisthorchis felineus TaxID=147828 RepID=A0A4V6RGW4_OPIFE|nr:hypothetical protein CRM22_007394 [Opisthorchis felineus]